MNELLNLEKALLYLFEKKLKDTDGHCKHGEPCITVGVTNELTWWAEIYSYTLEIPDADIPHGRRYFYEASTCEQLISKLKKSINKLAWEMV